MEYEETFLAWQRCAQHLFPSCAFRRKGVSRHLTSSTSSVLQAPHTASTVVIAPATKAYHRFIFRRYTEPHRYYHTMHHLELMLRDLKDYRGVCSFAPANRDDSDGEYPAWVSDLILDLAILFHDAVYVPGNVNNETRSVHLFRKFLQSARKFNCPPDAGANPEEASAYAIKSKRREWLWADPAMAKFVEEKVCELIMATKTHMETKPPTVFPMAKAATKHRGEEDDIKHLFLDLDLAVLGLPPTKYKRQYAVAIRREYSALSDVAFCEGRLKFLSGFLKEEQWFRTRYFFDRYEKQARCNVREEMIELEDKKRQLGHKPQAKL